MTEKATSTQSLSTAVGFKKVSCQGNTSVPSARGCAALFHLPVRASIPLAAYKSSVVGMGTSKTTSILPLPVNRQAIQRYGEDTKKMPLHLERSSSQVIRHIVHARLIYDHE